MPHQPDGPAPRGPQQKKKEPKISSDWHKIPPPELILRLSQKVFEDRTDRIFALMGPVSRDRISAEAVYRQPGFELSTPMFLTPLTTGEFDVIVLTSESPLWENRCVLEKTNLKSYWRSPHDICVAKRALISSGSLLSGGATVTNVAGLHLLLESALTHDKMEISSLVVDEFFRAIYHASAIRTSVLNSQDPFMNTVEMSGVQIPRLLLESGDTSPAKLIPEEHRVLSRGML
eukprot:6435081-Amphidinium_carterae.1